MATFKYGEKVMVRYKGRNMIGTVGLKLTDGTIVVDFVGESTRSLAYQPWQISKMNRKR